MRLATLALLALIACGKTTTTTTTQPPAAPSGLTATGGNGQISLSWTGVDGATSYNVLRGDSPGTEANPVASAVTNYDDTGLAAGKTYYYVVQAVNSGGTSGNSNEASATTIPAAPAGLTATGGAGQVTLAWNAVAGATSYPVSRATAASGPFTQIAAPAATTYTDTAVAGGTTYYYVVQAIVPQGTTAQSSVASATPSVAPPVVHVVGSGADLTVSWSAVAGATSYDVARAAGGTSTFTTIATGAASPYLDSGLPANTTFRYQVTANTASGAFTSAPVDATTAPAAPASVTADPANHRVLVQWPAVAGASSYDVRRGTSPGGPFSSVGLSSTTSFSDTTAANGATVYYVVRSLNATSASLDSPPSPAATPFRDICVSDSSASTISVFDGDTPGNVAPIRQLGWQSDLALVTGIAVHPGAGASGKAYVASFRNSRVNSYDVTVNGNVAPDASALVTSAPPRALAVDTTNNELWVAMQGKVEVYSINVSTGALTLSRTLTLASSAVPLTIAVDTTHDEVMLVVTRTQIDVYGRTTLALVRSLVPNGLGTNDILEQIAYDATGDGIFVVQLVSVATSIAEYPRAPATGCSTATPPVCAVDPLRTPLNGTRAATATAVVSDSLKVYATGTAASGRSAILAFPRTASGTSAPQQVLDSTSTTLFQPRAIAMDSSNSEFWVNYGQSGTQVFPKTFTNCSVGICDTPASRENSGAATGVFAPSAIAADLTNRELVVLNQGLPQGLTVYAETDSGGAVTPLQTISGPTTTLGAGGLLSVAVDEQNGEYWVANNDFASVSAFGRILSGDQAPLRSIQGASTTLAGPRAVQYDAALAQIVVADGPSMLAWSRTSNGDVPPLRNGVVPSPLSSISLDAIHDEILGLGATSGGFYARAFQSGPLTQIRPFNQGNLAVVDPLNDEVWVLGLTSLSAYSRTGGGTTPVRTIAGSATKLYNASSIAVCN